MTDIEVSNNELVARTLLVFWVAGCLSVLTDLDHIWCILGMEAPLDFTGWTCRPLHHPVVYLLYAVICGWLVVALVSRWDVPVPVRAGDMMIGELEFITGSDGLVIDVIVPKHMKDRVVFGKNSDGKVTWIKVYDTADFTWSDLE